MNLKNGLVTIALHSGKKEYYPLVENFLKSMLQCVTYPKIEIMLIESAGNQEIRDWFKSLDFNKNFVNFSGTESSIKKQSGVEILKTVKFYDFPSEYEWFQCFTQSIQQAINDCKGEYFCFFAEDNQFTVKGDIISDYIKIMEKENNFNSFVHFFGQQKYKLFKDNNYFKKIPSKIFEVEYFKPKHKWDFWSLTRTENYKQIGSLEASSIEKPHNTIIEYSNRTKDLGYVRIYPKIPHGVWFHNNDKNNIIYNILKNQNNPDYVFYKIFEKDDLVKIVKNNTIPLSTDDFNAWIN